MCVKHLNLIAFVILEERSDEVASGGGITNY